MDLEIAWYHVPTNTLSERIPFHPEIKWSFDWLHWMMERDSDSIFFFTTPTTDIFEVDDYKLAATKAVLAQREKELLELKGPCSSEGCRLHYAHSGPCTP